MVWVTLALLHAGERETAVDLVRESVVWLADRVEKGFGLARYEADEQEETNTLLGYPFDFINVEKNRRDNLEKITVVNQDENCPRDTGEVYRFGCGNH